MDWKVNDYFKTGLSYSLLENYKDQKKIFKTRHRARFYVQGGYSFGDFRLSLRETLQLTNRPGSMNTTQAPRNALALKTRLKLTYKGWKPVEPNVFLEMRTALNDAAVNATYNTATLSWSNYSFGGYGVVHNNRYRAGLGVDWKVAKHHKLEFGALFDYRLDREVDTAWHSADDDNSYLVLKSFNIERSFAPILTVGYRYSF